jgi:hypothetical protein
MKTFYLAIICLLLMHIAYSQTIQYSKHTIPQPQNLKSKLIVSYRNELHIWHYTHDELKVSVYDTSLNFTNAYTVAKSQTGKKYSPLSKIVQAIPFDDFYYLLTREGRYSRIFRVNNKNDISDVSQKVKTAIPNLVDSKFQLIKFQKNIFLIQAENITTTTVAYSIYQFDALLNLLYTKHLQSDQQKSIDAFSPINDSVILFRQIINTPDSTGDLLLTKINMLSGATAQIRFPGIDAQFLNSSFYPDYKGNMVILNNLMRLSGIGGLKHRIYSYLIKIDSNWVAGKPLFLSSPQLEDSLKIGSGHFKDVYTALLDDGRVLHIDATTITTILSEDRDLRPFRVSILDMLTNTHQYTFMPKGNYFLYQPPFMINKRLYFFAAKKIQKRSFPVVFEVNGEQVEELNILLHSNLQYDFYNVIQLTSQRLVIPYRYKNGLGFAKVSVDMFERSK